MVTIEQLSAKINNELQALTSEYSFRVEPNVTKVPKLSKNIQGWVKEDLNIYGLLSTSSGYYEAIVDEVYATMQTVLTLTVEVKQVDKIYDLLTAYQVKANAKVFTIEEEPDFSVLPIFDVLKVGTSRVIQGDDRIDIQVGINYTIAEKGSLANDVTLFIDGEQQMVLNVTGSVSKAGANNLFSGSEEVVFKPHAKSRALTIRLINTYGAVQKKIKREILTGNGLSNTYTIVLNDGETETIDGVTTPIEYTSVMHLKDCSQDIVAGDMVYLEGVFVPAQLED